jgi:hypothetical protein
MAMCYFSWGVGVERVKVVEFTVLVLPILDSGVATSSDIEDTQTFVPSGEQHTSNTITLI